MQGVTRPFCLVEWHIVKTLLWAGVLCFTSYTFCNNNGSCSLRLNERICICIHSSVFYLIELAVWLTCIKGYCIMGYLYSVISPIISPICSEGQIIVPLTIGSKVVSISDTLGHDAGFRTNTSSPKRFTPCLLIWTWRWRFEHFLMN